MLALVLAAALDVATLVPASSDLALVAEHAAPAAADAKALLTVAGQNSPILRPSSLGGTWERGLSVNPFDPDSLGEAGAAAQGGLALGTLGRTDFLVYTVGDMAKARSSLEAWLGKQLGDVSERKVKGDTLHLAARGKQVLAAYAIRGGRVLAARATAPGGDPLDTIQSMIRARSVAREPIWKALPRTSAPWRLWLRSPGSAGPLAASLARSGDRRLLVSGRVHVQSPPLLAGGSGSAPVPQASGALGAFRLRLAGPGPLASGLTWLVRQACERCPAELASGVATRLAKLVSGPAFLVLDAVNLKPLSNGGKLDPGVLPLLYAVPVRDDGAAAKEVAQVAARMGAAPGEGTSWSTGDGRSRLFFGVDRGLLYLATDAGARERGLAAVMAGGGDSGAPLAGHVDPRAIARALAGVSALDALRGGALAGIFAARLEVGAFLQNAGVIELTASPAGKDTYTFDLGWNLRE